VIDAVLEGVFAAVEPGAAQPAAERARHELATVDREIERFVEALAFGGDIEAVVGALKAKQTRQQELRQTIASADTIRPAVDRKAVERQVRGRLTEWRSLLASDGVAGRQLFREVLAAPIRFTPETGETLVYRFEGEVAIGRLFSGVAGVAPFMASPAGQPVLYLHGPLAA